MYALESEMRCVYGPKTPQYTPFLFFFTLQEEDAVFHQLDNILVPHRYLCL